MKRLLIFVTAFFTLFTAINAMAKELKISYVKSPFNLQTIVMKEMQFLEKELQPMGYDVKWLEINSGAKQAQALASGDLDIGGVMNTTSVLMANGEGNPVKIIAGVARPTDVFAIVGAKNGVKSISELKGKTIAGPKGTVLHQLLVAALAKEGMQISDVNFMQMDIPQAYAALQSGRVDAALLAANFVINAENEQATIITTASNLVAPVLVMTCSERFFNEHPELVNASIAAHDKAWQWIEKNPDEAIALGAKVQNIKLEEARKLYNWSHFTQRIKQSDLESMQKDMEFLLENDMMRNSIDVKTVVLPVAFEK